MDRSSSELLLTTTQVADLLSVHPSTVKRWCNEGELDFETTDGGHRRLHLADVLGLSRTRSVPTFLDPFTPFESEVWTAVDDAVHLESFDRAHSIAMEWLTRGHLRRVAALFTELGRHTGIPFVRFCDEGVRGFMDVVGETWRSGRLRVGEEHLVTEALIEVLLRMRGPDPTEPLDPSPGHEGVPHAEDGPGRPVAIVGSMEGDRHTLGSLCVRLALERRGWDVFYLGADVPVEDFAAMQRAREARIVCVSFAPPNTAADMKRAVRILGEFYQTAHPYSLALGGPIAEEPFLDDLELPFQELRTFATIADFDGALQAGLGLRDFNVSLTTVD